MGRGGEGNGRGGRQRVKAEGGRGGKKRGRDAWGVCGDEGGKGQRGD